MRTRCALTQILVTQHCSMTREFDFYALEDRVLLSADGPDGVETASIEATDLVNALMAQLQATDGQAADIGDPDPLGEESVDSKEYFLSADQLDLNRSVEVIFIDAAVDDAAILLSGLETTNESAQFLVVELSSEADGIVQVSDTLSQLSSVDAIHLVSHGDGTGTVSYTHLTLPTICSV